jgi:hypothetical protein
MSKNIDVDKEEIVEPVVPVVEPEVVPEPTVEPVKVEITGVDAPKK